MALGRYIDWWLWRYSLNLPPHQWTICWLHVYCDEQQNLEMHFYYSIEKHYPSMPINNSSCLPSHTLNGFKLHKWVSNMFMSSSMDLLTYLDFFAFTPAMELRFCAISNNTHAAFVDLSMALSVLLAPRARITAYYCCLCTFERSGVLDRWDEVIANILE